MNLTELQEQIILTKTKLHKLKTKKAKNKARDTLNKLESQALDILHSELEKYSTISIKGEVFHYDNEEVTVLTKYGCLHLSITMDVNSKSWYPETCCIEYITGQQVVIECSFRVNRDIFRIELAPERVYGGTLVNKL